MTTKGIFERNLRKVSTIPDLIKILRRLVKIILRVVLLKK
jgi:hypothetical protein